MTRMVGRTRKGRNKNVQQSCWQRDGWVELEKKGQTGRIMPNRQDRSLPSWPSWPAIDERVRFELFDRKLDLLIFIIQ